MKPVRYAGEPDPEKLDEFITFLQWHFCFCPCSEEEKVLVAACYLDGAALKWWTQQCRTNPRPLEIRTLQAFTDRLVEQFMPKSIRFEASEKLLKIKQGNLSISQYIDRFQTLLRQAFEMSPQFQYQCFMRGLNPSARDALAAHVRHSTTGVWPGLEEISAFFRREEEVNPTACFTASKTELKSDLEPMEVDAVGARYVSYRQTARRTGRTWGPTGGRAWGSQNTRKFDVEQRKCFLCNKPGHIVRNCKELQNYRRYQEQLYKERDGKGRKGQGHQGNERAPAQGAAQCGGLELEAPQAETLPESDQHYSAFQSTDRN